MTDPIEYLTPAEVAQMLRLHPKSIYRLAAQDVSMPALRLGGAIRFERAALMRWLARRTQGPGKALISTKPPSNSAQSGRGAA